MQFIKKIILNPRLFLIRVSYILKRLLFDLLFFFKKKYKYNIIFIAGMPMSASTKIKNMCGMIPGYFSRYAPIPYNIDVNQGIVDEAFKYCPNWGYSLFKTHLNPTTENLRILKKNNVKKVIVTYRDLRDVALARYHRLIKFPKKKGDPHYADYSNMNKSDAINHSLDVVSKDFIKWIYGWMDIYKNENKFVLLIKFENLILKSNIEFSRILEFYEINLDRRLINKILHNTEGKKDMVTNLNESRILPWELSSNFMSGKIGGCKEEFSKENISKAKKLLGNVLIELGYEDNLDWE